MTWNREGDSSPASFTTELNFGREGQKSSVCGLRMLGKKQFSGAYSDSRHAPQVAAGRKLGRRRAKSHGLFQHTAIATANDVLFACTHGQKRSRGTRARNGGKGADSDWVEKVSAARPRAARPHDSAENNVPKENEKKIFLQIARVLERAARKPQCCTEKKISDQAHKQLAGDGKGQTRKNLEARTSRKAPFGRNATSRKNSSDASSGILRNRAFVHRRRLATKVCPEWQRYMRSDANPNRCVVAVGLDVQGNRKAERA